MHRGTPRIRELLAKLMAEDFPVQRHGEPDLFVYTPTLRCVVDDGSVHGRD